jgi:hypothetical protein
MVPGRFTASRAAQAGGVNMPDPLVIDGAYGEGGGRSYALPLRSPPP